MVKEYSSITLRHIQALLEVAEYSNFTLAAKALNISQPALSTTIKNLEGFLGVQLFDRTTHKVTLTSDGEELLPKARSLIKSFYETIDEFKGIVEYRKGNVEISSLLSYALNILPKIIKTFSDKYPTIKLSIRDENSAAVAMRVKQREVDFGISSKPDPNMELDFETLFTEPFGVVCRKDWFETWNNEIDWKDLSELNYIGFLSETGIHSKIMEIQNLPQNIINPRFSVATISAFEGLLYEGIGFSILPWLAFPVESTQEIKFLKIINPTITREIGLLKCQDRSLSLASQAVYDLLLKYSVDFIPKTFR